MEQLAGEIQKALNNSMYSIAYHGGISVDVLRDGTTHEFKGFTYKYTQNLAKTDVFPNYKVLVGVEWAPTSPDTPPSRNEPLASCCRTHG